MNWILYFGLLLVGIGIGAALVYFAQSRNLPGPGQHTGPMLLADEPTGREAAEKRFARLLQRSPVDYSGPHPTPADGIEAVRPDGVIRVGADERNVQPRRTADHAPWSGSFRALTETGQQRRVDFIKAQIPANHEDISDDDLRATLASAMHSVSAIPVFGEAPVATVLAAQAEAEAAA